MSDIITVEGLDLWYGSTQRVNPSRYASETRDSI